MSLAPPPLAIYADSAAAFEAIQAHARATGNGYALYRRDTRPTKVIFLCDRAGKYDSRGKNPNAHSSRQRNNTGSEKCGCLMRVLLHRDPISHNWSVAVPDPEHNHSPSGTITAHPAHRPVSFWLIAYSSLDHSSRLNSRDILDSKGIRDIANLT
jgi:hypothetical protein